MNETMMTYILEEQAVLTKIVANRKEALREFIEWAAHHQAKRWMVLATGSSANAMEAAKYYVENIAKVKIELKMPANYESYGQPLDQDEIAIAVSQSGKSYSTIEAFKKVQNDGGHCRFALTANLDSPLTKYATHVIDIGCGVEKVGYVTKGFSSTILTFQLMGLEAAYQWGVINEHIYANEVKQMLHTIEKIGNVIEETNKWYEVNKEELIKGTRFVAIGYGPGYGIAREADTKMTETVRCPMYGHELEEYMHGPYLALTEQDTLLFLETPGKQLERSNKLKVFICEHTPYCYSITLGKSGTDKRTLCLEADATELLSPLLLAPPIQILSYRLAEDKGNKLEVELFPDFNEKVSSKV